MTTEKPTDVDLSFAAVADAALESMKEDSAELRRQLHKKLAVSTWLIDMLNRHVTKLINENVGYRRKKRTAATSEESRSQNPQDKRIRTEEPQRSKEASIS